MVLHRERRDGDFSAKITFLLIVSAVWERAEGGRHCSVSVCTAIDLAL